MPNNNNRINFQVGYNVDQASVNAVKKSLQDLQNIKFKDFNGPKKDLDDIRQKASQVEAALNKAFNVNLNSLNTQTFNTELQKAGLSIDKIYTSFSKAGAQGQVAFSRMASEVLTTNMQLKQTNSLVSQMGETMANTVKWGIASSVMNNFTNSVRQAFDYVKALDSSLNDIRIVTKQSSDEMANFAVQANNSAQALGRSTMDYTKAALTFYQQGLDEASVQARTESVLKAQNITGAGEEMADYLTAVWNGYKVANEEAELYVDKLAAVADSSASNMSQLAIAMSKVASSANLLGVPVDNLNAQIATIVATTRQAPESVGNALKTIYSRINDIATGADDAEISLGNYSSKMAQVGINVLDANGRLRDTSDVIDEIGGKWETLSHEQQIYLARTMAGQRQYNNLLALFENWGKYSDLVNVSMQAQGTTAQKNAIYMESLAAKMEQLGAAGEKVKSALIDEDDLKGLVNFGTGAVNLFGNLIQSIGGGKNAILALGSIFTQVFSGTIAKQLNNVITHFQSVRDNTAKIQAEIQATQSFRTAQQNGDVNENAAVELLTRKAEETQRYYSIMSQGQINAQKARLAELDQAQNSILLWEEKRKKAEQFADSILQVGRGNEILKQGTSAFDNITVQIDRAKDALDTLEESYDNFIKTSTKDFKIIDQQSLNTLKESATQLLESVRSGKFGGYMSEAVFSLQRQLNSVSTDSTQGEFRKLANTVKQVMSQISSNTGNLEEVLSKYNEYVQQGIEKTKALEMAIDAVNQKNKQLFDVTSIVKTASAFGQLASAINSLANIKNIWNNQNLSAGQKLLQTVTNLGMAIPMLVASYKTLNSTLGITNTLKTLFGGLTAANTAATEAQTVAQYGLNAAMAENPIGLIAMGITAAIAAISGLIAIYDKFTMSVQQANQAIDNFNQKQQQINTNAATYSEQASNLESLKNQYEQLAKKAGAINFDATIDNLTESERSRYNQIKNIIGQYNEDAIAGYNAQGQAILKNNIAIGQQISLLRQKRQEEIDNYASSQQFEDVKSGYQKLVENAQSDLTNYEDTVVAIWESTYKEQLDSIDSTLNNLEIRGNDLYQNLINGVRSSLKVLNAQGLEGLKVDQGDLEYLEMLIQSLENNTKEDDSFNQNTLSSIKETINLIKNNIPIDEIIVAENTYKEKIQEAIKMPIDVILLELQSSEYNTQYNTLVQQYGQAMANSLIRSYIEGANNGEGFTYKNTQSITAAVQQINEQLVKLLSETQISDSNIKQIQKKKNQFLQSLSPDQTSAEDYKKNMSNFIQEITYQNENLLKLAQTDLDLYESLIKTIFGFDDFSAGKNQYGAIFVENFSDTTTKAYDEAKQKVEKYFKQNPIDYSAIQKGAKKQTSQQQRLSGEDLKSDVSAAIEAAQMADSAVIEEFLNQGYNADLLDSVDLFIQYLEKIGVEGGNVKQALDQAADATRNYVSTMDSISTFDLLQQASAGDLSDQQFGQLSTELDTLVEKEIIAKETANILKTEWMQGTQTYKNALRQASNALLNYYQTAQNADPSSFEELSKELSNYITNIQTLHQAQARGLLTEEDHYNILGRLGSQYDSCSDQLQLFVSALTNGDQELINSTADALALAIQLEQTKQSTELIAESISQLNDLLATGQIDGDQFGKVLKEVSDFQMQNLGFDVDQYQDFVKILQNTNQQMKDNQYLARQMAKANMRISKGMEDLIANFDQWNDALLDFQENGDVSRLADSWGDIRQAMANLFDSNAESIDMLGPDFIANNLDKIQAVKDGVEGAYEQLDALMDQQLLLKAYGVSDFSELTQDVQDAYNLIQEVSNDATIQVGAVFTGEDDLVQAFNRIVENANWTSAQAQAAFADMGYDVEVEPKDPQMHTDTESTQYYVPPTYRMVSKPFDFGPFGRGTMLLPELSQAGHYESAGGGTKQTYEPGAYAIRTVTKNGKGSGGNISRGNAKSAAPRGGKKSGGGGGGGGGKKASPATQAKISTSSIDTKAKVSTPNPYQQEEKAYQRQSKVLDELQNKQKKLVNKDRLKNLQEQNKVLEKQKDILQKELAISANEAAENSTANYANRLKQAFKNIGFDTDGQISDINAIQAENAKVYNEAAEAAADAFEKEKQNYNNYIQNVWNKYATKQQQEAHKGEKDLWDERVKNAQKAANDSIKAAEEAYKEREDLIKSYNDAWKDDQKRLEDYNKLTDQIYDNLIAISKIKVDLSIDTGEFERDWLDFEKKFIKKLDKNDFLGSAKASAKELMSYFNSNQVQQTANQIKKIRDQIAIMNAGAVSSIYGTNLAQAKEDLEEYMSQQMKDLQEVQDMVDDIKDNYLDAIDNAKDKMDEQIDQYERVNDLVEHNMKMVELLYGDKAYDSMNKYYNLQKTNNERELESLKKQQDYWQSRMNNEVVGSEAWEKFKKNLDDVTDSLNDKLEDMIDNLAKQFENRVNGIIDRLNNALTGGRGLDFLDEQWDYISNYDDNFLDTFETKTGIEEVERLYQSQIDALVGSPKSQQKLNKLMNDQLKLLREKDHLTEYDLERAKASLEVEKARLALEEARDRKTKMRLRRDSQGNYTYQYVADEQKLGDLQAALADAQANLYNTDKQHYKQNLNTLYDTYKEYIQKMRDLTAEYNATQDEEERKRIQGRIDLLKESTAKLMSGLTEDNKYLLNYLNGSYFDGMGTDTSALTMEEQMEIMKENIPYMQSQIQDLSDTIVGEGGILPATANMIKEINAATVEYDKNVKSTLATAGTSLQTIEQAINSEGNALDKNIINAQKLITANDELIKSCQAQIEAMEQLLDYMDKYLSKIMSVETLLNNLRSAYNTGQGLNSSNLTADNINMTNWGIDTTAGAEYTGNPATDAAAIKRQIDALMAQYQKFLQGMSIATFDTGGYTGSWADASGRLAFLHQGELVLNQDDTRNILSAVELVRSMASSINGFVSGELGSLMSGAVGLLSGINNTEQLDQNVHIEANFPNVTQHTEIEQAFENLVNMASMRASKYRD